MEQFLQSDIAVQFAPHAVGHAIDDLGTILRGIDMDPERTPSEGGVHHTNDFACDFGRISIGGLEAGQALQRLVGNTGIGPDSYSAARALSEGEPE